MTHIPPLASFTTSLSNWVISNYKAIGQPTHTWMEQFAPLEFISTWKPDRLGKRVSAWNSLSFELWLMETQRFALSCRENPFCFPFRFVLFVSLSLYSFRSWLSSEPLSNFDNSKWELLEIKGCGDGFLLWFHCYPVFPRFCWELRKYRMCIWFF